MHRLVVNVNITLNAIKKEEKFDFYELAFEKIKSLDKGRLVSFRQITQLWGVNFHFSREQSFLLLKKLENRGWIEIHHYNGIKFKR
jgi:hypothetical protein